MTSKIFKNTFLVGLLVFAVCVAVFMGMLYQYFENRVFSELEMECDYVAQGVEKSGEIYFDGLSSANRVTWVAHDGTVLYDSVGDAANMENHSGRAEIKQAIQAGSGKAAHFSQIFMEKTLYYALRLTNGTIIRVSCTQHTVATLLLGMITPICWILVLVLLISALLASKLSKSITKPINQINLDDPKLSDDIKELQPLIYKLREQNGTICNQMEQLSRKQREFTAITENMSEGFILVDNRSNILSYNTSALRILDSEPGNENRSILHLNRSEKFRQAVDTALSGGHSEIMLEMKDCCYQLMANPVTSCGQVTGAVLVIMDVTEKEQRDALRREFTANVSHELKTPLTSISGFAEIMKDGMVPADKVREFSGDIYDESKRLINLVEDIIRLSKLDEESYTPEREQVDLYSLSENVINRLKSEAEKKNVSLELIGEHISIKGIPQILEEMIYNLTDNAIKYNREGGSVKIIVEHIGGGTRWAVADTGVGIPFECQSRVFERFYRVDKSHSKEIGGTGLGLSIVKHGAKYHDAEIELDSRLGEGTTISIVF